ncbi:fatty acyl-AMP ligase [Planktothrix agardhii 1029]|jgi:Acyl-CoA synthetases (AMP-forming)/AMP-acid ligases II|uniref:fatty acyl-AMP ligase n=1 Tax=Planktothrix agardhii TaxID=1160 RepID=UPI000DBADF7D|nr:fatty acyl-AMP ligase [Planktothrix agardhii]BBD56702.1 AMP-dependent synthetase and ligase [Planktothrix agardhii NIES-204]MCB8764588.1 fatty acyl-AMP ligase [Planktothrix agardhii 1809]MCB8766270.1 fatty acyl-AMP ligase [Planktothrix agardhii 1809]MCB8778244.1 fatty acyl-AMP ligase [Planktothrix agardhii 1031]MCB8782646.1 fatty acyl-AMP ligase [Planktothrix agardhii 1808]
MSSFSNLVDLLRDRAEHKPDQLAYRFLADGETSQQTLTYLQLHQQAVQIASYLQSFLSPGDRVLVVYPYSAGLEFIAAFFGCLYAGAIAVTDNPPVSPQAIVKLQTRLESSQCRAILSTKALIEQLKIQFSVEKEEETRRGTSLRWVATDDLLDQNLAIDWQKPPINGDTVAFLQYTSGSTGTPKGVIVTHGNVLHNSAIIYKAFGHHNNSKGLIWLPLFHDMGLIGGVVQPLYGSFPVTLMSPVALVQKPFRWLEAISEYQATTSGGPNFAYDLVCRTATPEKLEQLDLSSWDVAFSGAEPVRWDTLKRFAEIFGPCGFKPEAFYPCYGMAETTLFISGGHKHQTPNILWVDPVALEHNQVIQTQETSLANNPQSRKTRSLVSCGFPWLADEVMIVDPQELTSRDADQVGEILVSGKGVGLGYWDKPEDTETTFRVYVEGRGPYLRTGDLGFLQDGELYITGRIKDMMILWGRNRYPQEIEATLDTCHPAIRAGHSAAFSVETELGEQLIIAAEIERRYLRNLNVEEVVNAIRQAIAEQNTVDVFAIVLLKTTTIPKTTSGKIQRRACRTKFLEGSLDSVGQWRLDTETSQLSELANRS